MHDYPEAYTMDNLEQILESNTNCPDYVTRYIDRLVDLAEQRAGARGEQSALDGDKTECLITTEWSSYATGEFGFHDGDMNQVAMGVLNHSASLGKNATLFTDTVVVQNGWLKSGDGRMAQTKPYIDDDFEQSDDGDLWIPNGAQEYICIVALSPELVHEDPNVAEAM